MTTRYLLDRDVMSQLDLDEKDMHPNVSSWFDATPDDLLHVSAITIMEAWKGFASVRKKAEAAQLPACDGYEAAFRKLVEAFDDRVVPIDDEIARLWGEMLGKQDKNRFDAGVAATAKAHGMVVVTRNTKHFLGRNAPLLDPFKKPPKVEMP